MKGCRKSHDVVEQLRSIQANLAKLAKITEDGDGPLEYCGWRDSIHEEAVSLSGGLSRLITEAADDKSD